jgi:hypothetical protein
MTLQEIFYDLCRRTDSPVSLGLWLRFVHAQDELVRASLRPEDYNDPASFARDYACLSYLRKYKGLQSGIDKRSEALLGFGRSEEKCRETNERLRIACTTGLVGQLKPSILHKAQELMHKIWGRPSFDDIFGHCGWGPGATSTLKGRYANREKKMSQFPVSITPAAVPYFRAVMTDNHLWLRHLLQQDVWGPASLLDCRFAFTNASRVLTVPKDAKTDRTIAAEPTANIYLQKGVGGYLRRRLRRYGVDLDDQGRNQRLAAVAQQRGLATLDLKAASDTVSIGVVRLLCPPDMVRVLDRLRSPAYLLDGREARFHKFSSMGNGFTFELESAIFFSICAAIAEENDISVPIGVYGDDLVICQSLAAEVVLALEALGFDINKEKSYVDGRFFESCGKHFFDGIEVTPPYQKELLEGELEYVRAANRIFDWLSRDEFDILNLRRYFPLHRKILNTAPGVLSDKRFYGPCWVPGDGFFRVFNHTSEYRLSRGYKITYLQPRPEREIVGDGGLYADCMRTSAFLTTTSFDATATLGMIQPRPKAKVVAFKVRMRWVPLSVRELP